MKSVEDDEDVVLFDRALDGKGGGPLPGIEACIGVDATCLLEVLDDQRRIAEPLAAVLDERHLALGRLARIGRIDHLVGDAGDAQPRLHLAAERADIGDRELARELEQLDRRRGRHGVLLCC